MNSIRAYKLMTGEMVVATVYLDEHPADGESTIHLKEPIAFVPTQGPDGKPTLMPVPFVAKECWLYAGAVVAEVEEDFIQKDMVEYYRRATSGIVIASTMPRSN